MTAHAPMIAGPNVALTWRYGPAIIPWELGAENGLFQPILTGAQQRPKIDPLAGPYESRDEATNPVPLKY